jgi:F-type H+-transporting ATPase subunit a
MYSKIRSVILFTVILLSLSFRGFSAPEHQAENASGLQEDSTVKTSEKRGFNPSEFMMGHIKDAHEWHIVTIGKHEIGIPLPVILISKDKGLQIFFSSRFKHGEESYKGFTLLTSGPNKGKIVEENGIKPLDLSITKNIAAMFCSIVLLILIFVTVGNAYRRDPLSPPKGLQSWVEPVILFIRDDVAKSSIGPRYERYTPFLLTQFFFIWINNILGLIPFPPGGANLTGNIAVTGTLALFTFIVTTFSGKKTYWTHIFNMPGVPIWLKLPVPLIPLVEVIGVFTKPFVLMIRLFANITAGHLIGLGFISLIYIFAQMSTGLAYGVSVVSILFGIFMSFMELLVGFIQAFVFTFLSALYFGMAVEEHPHAEQAEHA